MRIATWNVNSIRARHDLLIDWLRRREPDLVALQETKVTDDQFPTDELERLGYAVAMAGQPTYNGVAILSRLGLSRIRVGLWDDDPSAERRVIAATVGDLRFYSVYVPNGRSVGSPEFRAKLGWLRRLRETLAQEGERLVAVAGDFNIARDERDVYDPEALRDQLHFHPEERAALEHLIDWGLVDAYRLFCSEAGHYSWWDYRGSSLRKNQGLRLDYVLVSKLLVERCRAAWIDAEERRRERPSDHVPVVVDLG